MRKTKLIFLISSLFLLVFIFSLNKSFAKSDISSDLNVNVCSFDSNTEGDCIIITYQDVEILIDCGEGNNTYKEIETKLSNTLENDSDKVWDYVIFTHADSDHIGNAVSVLDHLSSNGNSIGTIIDFDNEKFKEIDGFYTSSTYSNYISKRDQIINQSNTNYFSASTLSDENLIKTYTINDNLKLKILYNYFDNYNVMKDLYKSSNSGFYHNILSVCCLIEYYDSKLLFTGDLEEYDSATYSSSGNSKTYYSPIEENDLSQNCQNMIKEDKGNLSVSPSDNKIGGERTLLAYHRDLLTSVLFYKAAHHGSKTSNSQYLIECIKPQYVAVTQGPTGTNVGSFPNTEVLNNIFKYTDYIYPTKIYLNQDEGVKTLYGDLNFKFSYSSNKVNVSVNTENNNTISENSTAPTIWNATYSVDEDNEKNYIETLYSLDSSKVKESFSMQIIEFEPDSDSYSNCTLVKIGHYDILIDCGSHNSSSIDFIEKIKSYCIDNILEYVIITKSERSSYSQIVGLKKKNKLLYNGVFDTYTINNLIDFDNYTNLTNDKLGGIDLDYINRRDELIKNGSIKYLQSYSTDIVVIDNEILSFKVYKPNSVSYDSNYANSLSVIFKYKFYSSSSGDSLDYASACFVGSSQDYSNIQSDLSKTKVMYFRAPTCYSFTNDQLSKFNIENIVIGTLLGTYNSNGQKFGEIDYLKSLAKSNSHIYMIGSTEYNNYNLGTLVSNINYSVLNDKYNYSIYSFNKKRMSINHNDKTLDNNFNDYFNSIK